MNDSLQPHLTPEGIAFTVSVDYVRHDCLITEDALKKLSILGSADQSEIDCMMIFRAYEARINGIARRLVSAGVQGTPIKVNANSLPGSSRFTAQ